MKRIKYAKEPILHIHNYVVTVQKCGSRKYHYCLNLKEVRKVRESAPTGSQVHVFKAHHDFREAWKK